MSEHVWAKVYLELPTDPKLIGRSAHDCYLWVCLILIAKADGGRVPAWQARAAYLSKYARISLKETAAALAYFEDVGMVALGDDGGFVLPQFDKRQSKTDPTAAKRQRDKRDRERDSHGNVTRDSHDTRGREEADTDKPPVVPEGTCAEFTAFWEAYPPRKGRKLRKDLAEDAYGRHVKAGEHEAVLRAVAAYKASGEGPADAHRWLIRWQEWSRPVEQAKRGLVY